MKPGVIYRITQQAFDPSNDVQDVVDISDNDNLIDDSADATVIDLIPGGRPITSFIIDNSEDPFSPVKSQGLRMEINTDNPISLSTFASGNDTRWGVHRYIGAKTIFKGFLVLDDLQIPFMPDPNVLTLTATDGLSLLRDQVVLDLDGNNPVGDFKIIELLTMILRQTGLELGIKAAFNIKLDGYIDDIRIPNVNNQHFYNLVYLNAKTLEDQVGTCIKGRDALERILGEEAFLVQRQGYWWIVRVDEIEHPSRGLYISEWDSDGVFVGNLGEQSFNKEVGKDDPYTIKFSREVTAVRPTRPLAAVKLRYDLDTPREPLENIDFERGDLILDSGTTKTYSLADWMTLFSNTLTDDLATVDIYIRRIFEDDYEKERYVVIEASPDFHFIMSQPVRVGAKDKFNLGLQRRLSADIGGSGFVRELHVQVRLYGSDGTYWTHKGRTSANNEKRWVQCTSTFRTNQNYFAIEYDLSNDLTEAVGLYDGESAEIPVAGYVRVLLYASSDHGDTVATYYSGITFDYRPYINGSYQKYIAISQEVSQTGGYKAVRDNRVYVSDSPRMLFKGAFLQGLLFNTIYTGAVEFTSSDDFKVPGYQLTIFRVGQRLNISGTTSNNKAEVRVTAVNYILLSNETAVTIDDSTTAEIDPSATIQELSYELANAFYNAAVYPDGPPDPTYVHPYSEIQVYDVWNQFNLDKRIFEATLQGLDLAALDGDLERNNAHLVHKWSFTDIHEDTNNRFFQLLSFDQDNRTCEWKGTFREVYNILPEREKQYTGRTRKFLT
jgi:hypothetical protein